MDPHPAPIAPRACLPRIALLLLISPWPSPPSARAQDEPPRIAFIGLHGGVFEQLEGAAKDLGLRIGYIPDALIVDKACDLSPYRLVFIQHSRGEEKENYRELFLAAKKAQPPPRIFAIGREGMEAVSFFADLGKANPVETDEEISKYFPKSRENLRRFLIYAKVKYLGLPGEILPPVESEAIAGPYHPDHEGFFPSVEEFLTWSASKGRDPAKLPRAAIAVHRAHLEFQQPAVVDALVRAFEAKGVVAAGFTDGDPEAQKRLLAFKPDVVIHTCHSGETAEFREQLGVPHLHSLFFRRYSIDHWREHPVEGFTPSDAAFQVIGQEHLGAIEPLIGAGTIHGGGGAEAFAPIPDRIDHIVARALSWVRLRHTPNAQKRIAFLYYDRELGQNELMRGSATGMFLNAPRSMIKVLQRMKAEGYALNAVPNDEDELIGWLLERGRQYGLWNADELDRLARSGQAILVPEKTYREWFDRRVPEAVRGDVEKHWGPAPGKSMVWQKGDERFIVIPRIDLGNVILLPQPLRGEGQDPTLLHSGTQPPPHNYIATYFWLEESFRANSLVHFGTHGSEFFLPSKPVGLSGRDWPDILMGAMPNINPWIIDNVGEVAPVKRRAYGITLGHLTPPIVTAGLSDDLLNLHGLIDKWDVLEEGALRETFRKQITEDVAKLNIGKEAGLAEIAPKEPLSPEDIHKVAEYLHDIEGETTPVSLHVMGEPPREDLMVPFLTTILKKRFLDGLGQIIPIPADAERLKGDRDIYLRQKAEEAVELVVRRGASPADAIAAIGGKPGEALPPDVAKGLELAADLNRRFAETRQEIDNLLAAFDGRFIPPGPVNSPIRNPGSVPTGRNLYMLNPEEVPTKPSWELGKKLVDETLERALKQNGKYPAKIGFDLRPHATFRDFGVMEAQILYMLGVEPVWDERNLVNEVRLIPADALKRPRIDVFIAPGSLYEQNLPGRLELIDKAIRLVAELDEENNAIRANSERVRGELEQKGIAPDRAQALSRARIFGVEPGQYGSPGYSSFVQRSGLWSSREEVIEQYLAEVKHVYTKGIWGEKAPEAYDRQIQGTDTILRSWSDHMTSPLANKYAWLHGGSLALAVKHLTGKEPEYLLSDVRDFDKAGMIRAEDALAREFRVRLFNRKWIEGMMKDGYAGADQVSVMVTNAMGWEVVREGSIPQHTWKEIEAIYVRDTLGLSIREWFEAENPFAFQEMTATLLESIRKGYWKADAETTRRLAEAYARSVVRHGENGGLRTGGNTPLQGFVGRSLNNAGTPELAGLLTQYHAKLQGFAEPTTPAPTTVALGPAPGTGAAPTATPQPAAPKATASPPPGPPAAGPESADAAASQADAPAPSNNPATAAPVPIQGQRLEPTSGEQPGPQPLAPNDPGLRGRIGWALAAAATVLIIGGFLRRRNAA